MPKATGPTPGSYANRNGEYVVRPDGTVWLIGGATLPEGAERMRLERLPPDAAMTEGAMGGPASGGNTPPGKAPDAEQVHRTWSEETHATRDASKGGRMKIGIIGADNIGGTLTRRLTALGHEVTVANSRGPESLAGLARETGARAATAREAAGAGEIAVVTIPEGRVRDLLQGLFEGVPDSTVVIDTGNYYPQRDGRIEEIERGMPESRWVERQIGRPVIKAFNNIRAQHLMELGQSAGSPGRIALPVSGDDARAKQIVMRLIDELGFDPVDCGPLDESWRQQPGTPVYAADLDADGVDFATLNWPTSML